jgi:hypothetical protein
MFEQAALNKKDKGAKRAKSVDFCGFLFPLLSFLLKPIFRYRPYIFITALPFVIAR